MTATTIVIQLNVRPDWIIPKILSTSSPQDNENILEAGCRVLTTSKSESAGLSQKDVKERLSNDANLRIDEFKKEYDEKENTLTNEINDLKEKLESYKVAKSLAEKTATTLRHSVEEQISNATKASRKANENELSKLKQQNDTLAEKIRDEQVKSLSKEKELTLLLKEEAEKKIAKILKDNNEERTNQTNKSSKRERTLLKQLESERERYHALQTRQAGSAVKGGDNEKDFADLLVNTFGQSRNWKYLPKKHNSGDHLVMWEGHKLMFENKIGLTESQLKSAKGLPKAHDDFQRNTDCDALIFVSEDTTIPGHERPSNIDLSIIDNRPVIYIGRFSEVPDKLSYINSMLIPTLDILLKMHCKTDIDSSAEKEELQMKLSQISRLYSNFNEKLKSIKNEICAFDRQQKEGILRLKDTYKSVSTDFKSMLDIVTCNEYTDNTDTKKERKCRNCNKIGHDIRKCPDK